MSNRRQQLWCGLRGRGDHKNAVLTRVGVPLLGFYVARESMN
jgi:hypothetical protein